MNEHGLTPDKLKQKHAAEISRSATFETHGVSRQAAKDYLNTPEGSLYRQRLAEASPDTPASKIIDRAIDQLTSGRNLPRMETISEPLVKIVPQGGQVSPYSPFFAKQSELERALASGKSLSDHFGLPIASEAPVYDVYRILPKAPTEVFANHIAPTSELGGQVVKPGGATQYLVPNRQMYTEAVRVTSLGNDLALHKELVVGKGLGVSITPLAESVLAAEAATVRGARPGMGVAAKGLGAVGVAATAYDTADTLHDVGRLRGQGNAAAAEDRITRFAAQNLGGWGGAVAGAGFGAAAGVESGPGLLVTGAIGGIVGAVAGDKVAD